MLFPSKIRKLREEKKLLQRQLAAVLDIDTPSYGKIEKRDKKQNENICRFPQLISTLRDRTSRIMLADTEYSVLIKKSVLRRS